MLTDNENNPTYHVFGIPVSKESKELLSYKAVLKRDNGSKYSDLYLSLGRMDRRRILNTFQWSRQRMYYWNKKKSDPTFHSDKYGSDKRTDDLKSKSLRAKRRLSE